MKEKLILHSQIFGTFPSEHISEATEHVNVQKSPSSNNYCKSYQRIRELFEIINTTWRTAGWNPMRYNVWVTHHLESNFEKEITFLISPLRRRNRIETRLRAGRCRVQNPAVAKEFYFVQRFHFGCRI